MKSNRIFKKGFIKKLILGLTILLYQSSGISAYVYSAENADNLQFESITGKIVNKSTQDAVVYANIILMGTNIGTVSNANGMFEFKVPKDKVNGKISIMHIGYKSFSAPVEELLNKENVIAMEPNLVPLQEIIVRSEDPINILRGSLANIPKNYRTTPAKVSAFYREAIQQNKKYVSVAEAVLEVYKAPYTSWMSDRIKILIGRKSQDVKNMDTVVVKLQGGPVTPFLLDVVKNPENIISEEYFKYYEYKLAGQVTLDDAKCYVIEFTQRKEGELALYSGKIYVEVESLAVAGLEFNISEYGLIRATSMLVKKKPLTMNITITGSNYMVKYVKSNGLWNLGYVRSELAFKCKWKKRLFSSTYNTMSEMAVTDIDTTNISKYKMAEVAKITDVFSDKAEAFKDNGFWGDYNIIKPDETIMEAIEKLNKRLKKK